MFARDASDPLGVDVTCLECNRTLLALRYRRDPERWRGIVKEARRRRNQDPEVARAERERNERSRKARRAREPERFLAQARARERARRARVNADPALRRKRLEDMRIDNARRRERDGLPTAVRVLRGVELESDMPRVPSAPLVRAIEAYAEGSDLAPSTVCELFGISPRTLLRWREGGSAQFDSADGVLVALSALWWDVYDPGRWPDLYPEEEWVEAVEAARSAWEG